MRQKAVPEKKRSFFGNFGSARKLVESAQKKMAENEKNIVSTDAPTRATTDERLKTNKTNTEIEKKRKPHRYKPGTVALRECKKEQATSSYKNSMAISTLNSVIREIAEQMKDKAAPFSLRFQPQALNILREVSENFVTEQMMLANTFSILRNRKTLSKEDFTLAKNMTLNPHYLQQRQGSAKLLGDDREDNRKIIAGRTNNSVRNLITHTAIDTGYQAVPEVEDEVDEKEANYESTDDEQDSDVED